MLHYLKASKAIKSWIWTTEANKAFPEGHKTFLKQETHSRIRIILRFQNSMIFHNLSHDFFEFPITKDK